MFENPRRGRQARNFTTNVPKILDLKSSSEQIFSRKLSLGAPVVSVCVFFLEFQGLNLTETSQGSNSTSLSGIIWGPVGTFAFLLLAAVIVII